MNRDRILKMGVDWMSCMLEKAIGQGSEDPMAFSLWAENTT